MAGKTWVLSAPTPSTEPSWRLDSSQVDGVPAGWSVVQRRLSGGLCDGVEVIEIHNGRLRLDVLPTRGMGIWQARLGELRLGWQSPVRGPVHPKYVPLTEPSGLGWLDGFDELLCRCGATSNGAPDFDERGQLLYPLHGRLANRPAHHVELSLEDDQMVLKGVVDETRFHFAKLQLVTELRTRFGEPGFELRDRIVNLSASPQEIQMLYHINFGTPLLMGNSELSVPAKKIVPRNAWSAEAIGHWSTYTEPTPGTAERVYFFDLWADAAGQTMAVLHNPRADQGVAVEWNRQQLPCFTQWKNETSLQDGYVTGIEPATNFPNPRSFEANQGRVVRLAAEAAHEMTLKVTALDSAAAVQTQLARVAEIQAGRDVTIHDAPRADWCA